MTELVCPIPPGVNDTRECATTELRVGDYVGGRDHADFVISDGKTTFRMPLDVAREFAHHALAKLRDFLISIGDCGRWVDGQWEWHTAMTFHQGSYSYSIRQMGKFPDCDPVDFFGDLKQLVEYAPVQIAGARKRHAEQAAAKSKAAE